MPAKKSMEPRELLLSLWEAAIGAASVGPGLKQFLPPRPTGHIVVVGAGKAAAAMAAAVAEAYGKDLEGTVVTRRGHGLRAGETSGKIRVIEAGHPLPDGAGLEAGTSILQSVRGLTPDDLVLCLLSGGGSALLEYPLPGIRFSDIKTVNKRLLECGASIGAMNCVRKHLSAIKGGRLAAAAYPAQVVTLAISDVPGDDPATIASGPTVPDPTSADDAVAILERYQIRVPSHVMSTMKDPNNESPKPGNARLQNAVYRLVATQSDALNAAINLAGQHGLHIVNRGTTIEGEARIVAAEEASIVRELARARKTALVIGGGELTVTLQGAGSGGPNREYALALALELNQHPDIWGLAADTDGIDGTDDAAGAIVAPDTLKRARASGLNAAAALQTHDSGAFFTGLGDALVTGPTRTNVSDFRALLVLPDGSRSR